MKSEKTFWRHKLIKTKDRITIATGIEQQKKFCEIDDTTDEKLKKKVRARKMNRSFEQKSEKYNNISSIFLRTLREPVYTLIWTA